MAGRHVRHAAWKEQPVQEVQQILGDIQQALIGSPVSISPEDSDEVASRLLQSIKAAGGEMPETLCGGRLSVDQVQRLIRIDGHPIGITEMEYRVLELLAFARNNVVTRSMLLKHLYRRADDQPQPKIIDVFISKLRKKLRSAAGGAEFIETIPQRLSDVGDLWARLRESKGVDLSVVSKYQ